MSVQNTSNSIRYLWHRNGNSSDFW
jgi:hypothetical protein